MKEEQQQEWDKFLLKAPKKKDGKLAKYVKPSLDKWIADSSIDKLFKLLNKNEKTI